MCNYANALLTTSMLLTLKGTFVGEVITPAVTPVFFVVDARTMRHAQTEEQHE